VRFTFGPPEGAERDRLAAGLGRIIGELREERGWSKAELRRRSDGVDTGGYERGRVRPTWRSLCKLAVAFFPFDDGAARALAQRLADATGPSLSAAPGMPVSLSRELVVEVVGATLRRFGLDPTDDQVRHVVVEELRRLVGEEEGRALPAGSDGPIRVEAALAIEGSSR
jgi:transcriptional regulator with XRE-family HTH domain